MTTKIKASNIETGAVTADKLHTTAITDKLGFTPVTPTQLNNSISAIEVTPTQVSDQANTSTGYFDLPAGTTEQRPETATEGMLRYNTTLGLTEQYTSLGWQSIDAPPVVISFSGTINADTSSTITVTGSNFRVGSVVYIEGAGVNGIPRALTTTYVSPSQLTANTNASTTNFVGGASFDIKVTNSSGLSGILAGAGIVDRDPIWSTSAGTISTINDAYGSYSPISTLSASDPDGTSITYSLTSGSLPTNVSLNTSTGAISGDPENVTNSTTYTFEVTATSNSQSIARTFNIIVNPALDGTTSARAASSATSIASLTGTTSNGMYWLNLDGTPRQFYCDMANGGYILFSQWNQDNSSTSFAASNGYSGAPTSAVATPSSSEDVYGSYGSLYGNTGASVAYSMNGPMQWWQDSEMGYVWSRQDSNGSGSMRYYRPKIYGYNWRYIKFRLRIATCGSLDGWNNVGYTGIDQPSCEGVQLFKGLTTSRTHIYSYPLANSGGGGAFQGSKPSYVGDSDYYGYTMANQGDALTFDEITRDTGSSTTIPPEMRIGTDQDARVNGSGNENAGLKAWYIFLK